MLESPLAPMADMARQNMELWAKMQASMFSAFTPGSPQKAQRAGSSRTDRNADRRRSRGFRHGITTPHGCGVREESALPRGIRSLLGQIEGRKAAPLSAHAASDIN